MSKPRITVPDAIEEALEGLPWEAVYGGRHVKILLAGRLATILPRGTGGGNYRGARNALASVKRAVREYREQKR